MVRSEKAGLGKTLYKNRLVERLNEYHSTADDDEFPLSITIPLNQEELGFNEISSKFMDFTLQDIVYPRILHIDVACGVPDYILSYYEPPYTIDKCFCMMVYIHCICHFAPRKNLQNMMN